MKRLCTLILVVLLIACLSGCKSKEVKNVEEMINAIGTVTVESQAAIDAAKEAYKALSEEDAAKVENYGILLDAADSCLELQLVGTWNYEPTYFYDVEEMYDQIDVTLNADMTAEGEYIYGTWWVEDGNLMVNNGEYDSLYGIKMLNGEVGIAQMMRTEDYKALLDDMFEIVELNSGNIEDYCAVTIFTEIKKDAFGTLTGDTSTYPTLISTVYDDGLIYFEASDDLAIELLIPEHKYKSTFGNRTYTYTAEADSHIVEYNPYGGWGPNLGYKYDDSERTPVDITAEDITFGRVIGKLVFINADYVKEVKPDSNGSSRLVILESGEEIYAGTWKDGLTY